MTLTDIDRWTVRFMPMPEAPVRLVCFPHAGGAASSFFTLAKALSPRVEVVAIQYPGRQNRRNEPVVDSIHRLADLLGPVMESLRDKPLALFGHSMGAVVAYEVAQAGDFETTRLFASARRAPSTFRRGTVHLGRDRDIIDEIRKLNGTAGRVLDDEEILRSALPVLRGDYKAIETYRPRPGSSIASPITALIGRDDPEVSVAEARAWAEHTTSEFDLRVFEGGHFYNSVKTLELADLIADQVGDRPRHEIARSAAFLP
ncbi:thioesterase II family protein [Nocardia sp. NPDC052316]|uniref:thioesterase II family protein n=1 Tax=Nocardia sp. NPDC052316 TaxID=3364329 RepID=UPI0037C6F2FB